jgi:hypothetical protein
MISFPCFLAPPAKTAPPETIFPVAPVAGVARPQAGGIS